MAGDTSAEVPVGSLADSVEALGASLNDKSLTAQNVRLRSAVELRRVTLDELVIDRLVGIGPIRLIGCRIASLRLSDIQVREGIIIEDCEIGNLQIRSAKKSAVVIVRSSARRLSLHACRSIVVDDSHVAELASISEVQVGVELARTTAGALRVAADGETVVARCELQSLTIRDRLDVNGLWADQITFADVVAARVQLRHVHSQEVGLNDLAVEKDLVVRDLGGTNEEPVALTLGGIVGTAAVEASYGQTCQFAIRGATIRGDLAVGGVIDLVVAAGSRVEGTVQRTYGALTPRMEVEPGATVRAITPPSASSVRSPNDARRVAVEMLGRAGRTELEILRDSLGGHPDEQDMTYFALRQVEAREARGFRRVSYLFRSHVLGWGVTFLHPLRTLCIGILCVSALVYGINPSGATSVGPRVLDALTASLGLWFNVGTGMPAGLAGPTWGITAVVLTAMGIALVTVLTGVAIRRLTR